EGRFAPSVIGARKREIRWITSDGGCRFEKSVKFWSSTHAVGLREAFLAHPKNERIATPLQLNEGLQVICECAFEFCMTLQSVTMPSTVTLIESMAFGCCISLTELQLNEGLQIIGNGTCYDCSALRSVTIPSTVTFLGAAPFGGCRKLSEVKLLCGNQLFNQEFVDCDFRRDEQELLNQEAIKEMLFDEDGEFAFQGCPLTTLKISISWAVSERMARLPHECMLSVEERIHNLRHLELLQDGSVLAHFSVVSRCPGDNNAGDDSEYDFDFDEYEDLEVHYKVLDTNKEAARCLYQVLQSIAFYELKESSFLIELALWKSMIDKGWDRECRVAIPGPAKSLLMEYCGFAGFLRPAF
ncbi:hypothetical protein THAOC_08033, partial [Thalassiosira oceanica]